MIEPASRDLSAPELSVLRRAGRGNGREALRMAVVELVERGVLRRESNGGRVSVQLTEVPDDLEPPLAAVAVTLDSPPMSLRALEHDLSLRWATPREYVWSEVVPVLCDQGLARIAHRSGALGWLGPRLVLTPAGREAAARAAERLARTGSLFGTGGALAGGLSGWAMGGGGFGDGGGAGGCGGDGGGGGGG